MTDRATLWWIGCIGGVLLLAGIAGWLGAGDSDLDPRASTYLRSAQGAAALHTALTELEVDTRRHHLPLERDHLPAGPFVFFAPGQPLSPREAEDLQEWVEEGGILFLIGPLRGARPGLLTGPFSGRVGGVDGDLFRRTDFGAGVVYTAPPDSLFRNAHLHASPDHLHRFVELALSHLGPDRALTFGEYHHGFREGGSPLAVVTRFATRTSAGHLSLYLLAVLVLGLLVAGRRFGAPPAPVRARRRSALEHVDALARIYEKANARRHAADIIARGLLRRLGRRIERPVPEEIYALRARSAEAAALARRMRGALESERPDLADLTRNADALYMEWTRQ